MFEDSTLDLKVLTAADSFMKAYPTNKAVNLQFEQKITYDARALVCSWWWIYSPIILNICLLFLVWAFLLHF